MKANEQTNQQIDRALRKVASKFRPDTEATPLTDIYLQVKQESGELLAYNDDEEELTRCVVEQWIGNTDEDFYTDVQHLLTARIAAMKAELEALHILKPYSFVLMGEDKETLAELYLVDDDTIMLDADLMKGLGEDLDRFWNDLVKDK